MKSAYEIWDIRSVIPYENNPRHNNKAVEYVAASIREFGFRSPIVVDEGGVIIAGHTRLKAAKSLELDEVPVLVAHGLDEEQVKALRLADNKTGEFADWDIDALKLEMEKVAIDMQQFGFDVALEEAMEEGNPYTNRIEAPFYEPTGEDTSLKELVDTAKRDSLVLEIQQSDIPEDIQDFLIMASQRHLVFDYRNIAEYYSNADKEVQELMERSALVIIDFEDAIRNGYVKLAENAMELIPDEDR